MGDCEQDTSFRSALSELNNVKLTFKIKEIKLCAFYINYKKSTFSLRSFNQRWLQFFFDTKSWLSIYLC